MHYTGINFHQSNSTKEPDHSADEFCWGSPICRGNRTRAQMSSARDHSAGEVNKGSDGSSGDTTTKQKLPKVKRTKNSHLMRKEAKTPLPYTLLGRKPQEVSEGSPITTGEQKFNIQVESATKKLGRGSEVPGNNHISARDRSTQIKSTIPTTLLGILPRKRRNSGD